MIFFRVGDKKGFLGPNIFSVGSSFFFCFGIQHKKNIFVGLRVKKWAKKVKKCWLNKFFLRESKKNWAGTNTYFSEGIGGLPNLIVFVEEDQFICGGREVGVLRWRLYRHTGGHGDSISELAQWAHSVKKRKEKSQLIKPIVVACLNQIVVNNFSDEQIQIRILFPKDILYKYKYEYYY